MSSTNKTTHYHLSQYTANDKPTYLVDYNNDMSNIDTAIYDTDTLAKTNESAIGLLSDLNTTVKSDLVSAINEIEGDVSTLNTTVSNHTTEIATNTSAIGTLANLTTYNKSNLVNAINEINGEIPDYYDSIEHLTNKIWVDGKQVYRIVYSGNITTTGSWVGISTASLHIDHLVDVHMKLVTNTGEEFFNNFYISTQFQAATRFNDYDNEVQYLVGSGFGSGSTYRIIVEYTKN